MSAAAKAWAAETGLRDERPRRILEAMAARADHAGTGRADLKALCDAANLVPSHVRAELTSLAMAGLILFSEPPFAHGAPSHIQFELIMRRAFA